MNRAPAPLAAAPFLLWLTSNCWLKSRRFCERFPLGLVLQRMEQKAWVG